MIAPLERAAILRPLPVAAYLSAMANNVAMTVVVVSVGRARVERPAFLTTHVLSHWIARTLYSVLKSACRTGPTTSRVMTRVPRAIRQHYSILTTCTSVRSALVRVAVTRRV